MKEIETMIEANSLNLRNYIQDIVDSFEFDETLFNAHVQGERETFYK